MNKESRGNILESTRHNIFVPQHKSSVLNADVSSKRGSSSQAPLLKKYSRPPKVMNVLKTAPQLRISVILGRQTSSGAKRWIGWKIDTNKGSKFKTTDDGWCWYCTLHHISTSFFVFFPLGNNVFPLFIKWVSRSLDDPGLKLRDPSPLSCWSLCSCCYFKICLTETPLVTEVFN